MSRLRAGGPSETPLLRPGRHAAAGIVEGRWVIDARHGRHPWEVIVEPDSDVQPLVVVTAYPVWGIQ